MTAAGADVRAWLAWLHGLSHELAPLFARLDANEERQTERILQSFTHVGLAQHHFNPTTGYGYNDSGRETLEAVYAEVFESEAALVRQQIVSGTQAIHLCLRALVDPGREILFAGMPYDTLRVATGLAGEAPGNLRERGIMLRVVETGGRPQKEALAAAVGENTALIYLQRSGGYAERPAWSAREIGEIASALKGRDDAPLIFVDNCYGEFVEESEPTKYGVDLMAGSLIKNPGGGLAPCGGYIVGRRHLVERVAAQLYAPGVGGEAGPSLVSPRLFFQGLFQAPHLVGQALRGAILCARAFGELGFAADPAWNAPRADIVQRITFGRPETLLAFARSLQGASPVDSRARVEPGLLPGYGDLVIMAGGTFIQGSSSELSLDGPLRPPYTGYWQGGLSFTHARLALARALSVICADRPAPKAGTHQEMNPG